MDSAQHRLANRSVHILGLSSAFIDRFNIAKLCISTLHLLKGHVRFEYLESLRSLDSQRGWY